MGYEQYSTISCLIRPERRSFDAERDLLAIAKVLVKIVFFIYSLFMLYPILKHWYADVH